MLLWCSFWLVRVGPSECGARVREGMDLISCCMSTLDDRRAVDESGGGGRGNGAQRGGGQSHAAWSNLSRGRTMFRLRFGPDLSRGFRLAELRFVREPFARCDPSESGGNARETPRSRARSRGPERPQSQRCRALAVAPCVTHDVVPERLTSSPPTCFPEGGSPNARPQSFIRAQSPRPRHAGRSASDNFILSNPPLAPRKVRSHTKCPPLRLA